MGRAFEVRKQSMAKTAAKKSKVYARYGREIYIAAKGSPDPDINLELKRVLERARKEQVPKDIIERAIEKAKGGTGEDYTETRYEFIGPGGSLFIIECLTDNVTRTIHNVRDCFTKTGGKSASVLHMFEHRSVLAFSGITEEEVLETLINNYLDIEDLENEDGQIGIISTVNHHHEIREALLTSYPNIEFEVDEITWLPLSYQTLTEEENEVFIKLQDLLDEVDDVQNIYHNITK